MISHNELLAIKERLLVASAAAKAMVESPNQPVLHFDEEQYWRVHVAFMSLHNDATAVLAELDTLRGMFADRVNEFINGGLANAINGSSGNGGDGRNDVAEVPDAADVGSREAVRTDDASPVSDAPAKRPRRGRKPRSLKTGDQGSLPPTPEGVDGGTGGEPVGGTPTNA